MTGLARPKASGRAAAGSAIGTAASPVRTVHVLTHHALGGEEGAVQRNGEAADSGEVIRSPVVEGGHHLGQDPVELGPVGCVDHGVTDGEGDRGPQVLSLIHISEPTRPY